jgi:hypothetical protein
MINETLIGKNVEAVVVYFEVLSPHSHEGTYENHENGGIVGGCTKIRTKRLLNTSQKHYFPRQLVHCVRIIVQALNCKQNVIKLKE